MTVGIIGYGAFGQLLAGVIVQYANVWVYDKNEITVALPGRIIKKTVDEIASCQIVIIACGISDMPEVCEQLAKNVKSETIVMDVCSVKIEPIKILKKHLSGKCQLISTHPLFGPQTVSGTNISGQKIVICPVEIDNISQVTMLLRDILQLEIIQMEPEKHDQEMAWVHALTFFVGRGLLELDLPQSQLGTGYYQKLLDLVDLEKSHSQELFETIELGNPYAGGVRSKLIEVLRAMDKELKEKND